jgi:hypothetical protein
MKNLFRGAKFAVLSLGCVAASFFLHWIYVWTGTYHTLGSSFNKVGRFAVLIPCLIAIVLALASVIWNRRKAPGLIGLVIAVAGTSVLFYLER